MFIPALLAVICRSQAYCVYLSIFFVRVCVFLYVTGVEDIASSCRGDGGDACRRLVGLASSHHTPSHSSSPTSQTSHTSNQSSPLSYHRHSTPHTHTHTTEEERRTPNAISTPLSTFVLMNRGGLVIRQAACCCSRAAGSQNIQAA